MRISRSPQTSSSFSYGHSVSASQYAPSAAAGTPQL
jgi:hypothetical protein